MDLLEDEFDPETYDTQMNQIFSDDYYNEDNLDNLDENEIEKQYQEFDDDEYSRYGYVNSFKRAVASKKQDDALEKYIDEYYNLDFGDMIAGKPAIFKYVTVPAKGYGLSTTEILEKEESELNSKVSLRKLAPYRDKKSGAIIAPSAPNNDKQKKKKKLKRRRPKKNKIQNEGTEQEKSNT